MIPEQHEENLMRLLSDIVEAVNGIPAGKPEELVGTTSMVFTSDDMSRACNAWCEMINRQTRKKRAIGRIINSLQQPRKHDDQPSKQP
jgi:hypothetical protein